MGYQKNEITIRRTFVNLVFLCALFLIPTLSSAAAQGDGVLFYGASGNTTPQTRDYIAATNLFGASSGTVSGAQPVIVQIKSSPTKEEFIAGYQDTSGNLRIMCYNGSTWSNDWTIAVAPAGTPTTRRFDIAYETATGDVTVAYSRNTAATNALAYRTKPGSSSCGGGNWSAAANFPTGTSVTTGTVQWVKAERDGRAGSNLDIFTWADSNSDLGAVIWDGAAFTNLKLLETNLERVVASQDVDNFEAQFESLSGDIMVVWGTSGASATNLIKYATCTGGTSACTWSAVGNIPTVADAATNIDLAADPTSDRMSMSAIDNGSSDLSAGYWSGNAWTGYANIDITTETPQAGMRLTQTGWLTNGATTKWFLTYDDASGNGISWFLAVPGSAPVKQNPDWSVTPAINDIRERYMIDQDPFNTDRAMLVLSDASNAIYAKRIIMDAAGTVTWSDADGGASLGTLQNIPQQGFSFIYRRFIPIPTVSIAGTVGSQITSLDSGGIAQYANDPACTSTATCASFTISGTVSPVTVTSIKISETGTVNASSDLSNLALFYDTDGNYSNGVTGQYGATVANFTAEAATVNGSLILTPGVTYYFYVRYDLINGTNNPVGGGTVGFRIASNSDVVIAEAGNKTGAPATLAGSTIVRPRVTSITYPVSPDGGRVGQTISTINGYGFGTTCDVAGGSKVTIETYDLSCTGATFNKTTISIPIDSGVTVYGGTGVGGLLVTIGNTAASARNTFYIYPSINQVNTPIVSNAARETEDVTLTNSTANAAKFGAVQGTVDFVGAFGTVPAAIVSWSDTSISVTVPPAIADNIYLGDIRVTRASDSKTALAYSSNGFRILPHITANNPTSGLEGDMVQITGDHFCQTGVCPVSPNRSSAMDNILFGATQALESDFSDLTGGAGVCNGTGAAWAHTEICVKVPIGIPTGSQPSVLTSNSFNSNQKAFNIISPVPLDPAGLNQFADATLIRSIPVGGTASTTPLYLTMILESVSASPGTLYPQIEYKPTGTSFTCVGGGSCGAAVEGNGVPGPGPVNCAVPANNCAISVALADGTYHWQARTHRIKSGNHYYSNWVSFGGNPEPSGLDVLVDTTPPAITNVSATNIGTNQATISWDTLAEVSTTQVQYNKTGVFNNDCSVDNDCTTLDPSLVNVHTVIFSNIDSGTTYYYRVRSMDAAGNESISAVLSFVTLAVTKPAKTTMFAIVGLESALAGGVPSMTPFSVFMSEDATTTESAFIVIEGIYDTSGALPNGITVQVNSESAATYTIPTGSSATGHFTIKHRVNQFNIGPTGNTLTVTPGLNTSVYTLSAFAVITYSYTP